MRRLFPAWAVLVALALPVRAQEEKKKPDAKKEPLDASKVLRPGDTIGKLGKVSGNSFILQLEYNTVELKPGAKAVADKRYQNLQRQQQKLASLQQQLLNARTAKQASSL